MPTTIVIRLKVKKRLILASGLLTDFLKCGKAPAICPETAAGGPVLIPVAKFNEGRDKQFFFYSVHLLPRTDPSLVQNTLSSGCRFVEPLSRMSTL